MATRGPDQVPQAPDLPATVEETLRAQQEGARAAADNQPVGQCPHRLLGTESPTQADRTRFLQLMWLRGYRHSRGHLEDRRAAGDLPSEDV